MKIYLVQGIGTPLLTACKYSAHWYYQRCLDSGTDPVIYEYEVKTQGKNWHELACAMKHKLPF